METAQQPIVIFEPFEGGHRGGFVRYLYQEVLRKGGAEIPFIFYVNDSIAETLLPPSPLAKVVSSPTSMPVLAHLKNVCAVYQPREIMLMAFGDLEWPLLFWRCPVPISSILFVQYPEIRPGLKRWLKEKKTGFLLKRIKVRYLFLLNGSHSASHLTQKFPGDTKFIQIPDPVSPFPEGRGITPAIRWSKTVFLYFGAISRRKGFGVLVDALLKLNADELGRMKFLICGRPEDSGYFNFMLTRIERSGLPVNLEVVNRFLSEEEMFNRFLGSDVVLMPYLRPEYSSGVLGIAAQTLRPVIGPDRGLLGRLIRGHRLGVTCKMNAKAVKKALISATETGVPFDGCAAKTFADQSLPSEFARLILEALTGDKTE
jgi:glycosyltransferase involved in cell wall biosynthesis